MAAAALKVEEPTRPPERQRLAEAGATCNSIEADLRRLRDLSVQSEVDLSALQLAAEDAEEGVKAAREAEAKYGVARLLGRAVPADIETTEQASARLDEVQRAIQSMRNTRTELAEAVTITERQLGFAQMELQKASIVRVGADPKPDALLARLDRLWGEVADVYAACDVLGPIYMPERLKHHAALSGELRAAVSRYRPTLPPAHPIGPAWRQAIGRLLAGDPDAELPDVG
jgi:hypothetical protein